MSSEEYQNQELENTNEPNSEMTSSQDEEQRRKREQYEKIFGSQLREEPPQAHHDEY